MEEAHEDIRKYTSQFHKHALVQAQTIRESCRHLEDLDNGGQRNNIRVRGLPKAEVKEDVHLVLESIANKLLGNPASHKIKIDRAHCALRPKGASTQPGDSICFVHDFA